MVNKSLGREHKASAMASVPEEAASQGPMGKAIMNPRVVVIEEVSR